MSMDKSEEYLGDGLYASFDGFQITLRAPRAGGNHYVALEPSVLHEFERYVKRLRTTDSSSAEPTNG
jgi:hypothetical protein